MIKREENGHTKSIYVYIYCKGSARLHEGMEGCMSMTWNNRCDGIRAESRPTILEHDDMKCLYSRYCHDWQLHTHIPPESMVMERLPRLAFLAGAVHV